MGYFSSILGVHVLQFISFKFCNEFVFTMSFCGTLKSTGMACSRLSFVVLRSMFMHRVWVFEVRITVGALDSLLFCWSRVWFLGCSFRILFSFPLLLGVDFFDMVIKSSFGLENFIAVGKLALMLLSLWVVVASLAVVVVANFDIFDVAHVEIHFAVV